MRPFLRWLIRSLIALTLAAVVVGVWKRDEIMRLWAVNGLFSEAKIVANFSSMDAAFLTREVPRGDGPISPLPTGAPMDLPAGAADWIKDRSVTSLLVLKTGEIVHESYHLGTGPEDRRISWSMAKSFVSALVGVLLENGTIASLDDPVTQYAPSLNGTAYEDASIRNVLHMASGVQFDEDYLDKSSDINRMGRVLALGGTMDDFTRGLTATIAAPGARYQYVSIDTHVVGMVIRGATGRDISTLLSEEIIMPLGVEATPYYVTDGAGVAFVLGGLNMTTRDYARFGLMASQNGRYGNQRIVPAEWMQLATRPSAPTEAGQIGYGLHWWVPEGAADGEFMARGIYGQYIYINQNRDTVIVSTGADRNFRAPGTHSANMAMFRAIAMAR
ncbi:serine hydrolase domain-containing protein [Roseovarius pelagicus]|uniref:Beta-lactamase family protein n=1 Tax=Roseovarius pelagicus TaxID=2980108 RepID=A0ABY6DJA5_9RHOB|nr:serine hydrolase [Roseovarius pelagicus]UXX85033.1 beta-lactamase family protein [Roseovarius pelagicus]